MPIIKVEDIAHVRFAAPDLTLMRSFLDDFGLNCFEANGKLYAKGGDGRPFVHVTQPGEAKFLALGLRAESLADLEQLAAHEGLPVDNLDDLMLGHQHLKSKGREAAWGVGRHILGSQVFDYWKDPFGNELEHWIDGDLLTAAEPPQNVLVSELRSVQWGSPHPSTLQQAGKP